MINRKIPAWLTIEKKDRSLFFALTVMYSIYVLPIILANRFYQDDLSRSLYGITGWNNDARPLTEKLVTWLCGGSSIGDVFPLPLFLSVLLLAYTITLYAKRYLPSGQFKIPALGIGFLVIANPFFLSNLSYRFDSVTMVLALCAAILPYVIPEGKALWTIFAFSAFMCLVTFTTYQPAAGVYISLWFLELFYMLFASRIDFLRLFVHAVSCGCSVVVYKYVILNRYIRPADGGWQYNAYRFAWRSETGMVSGIVQNLQTLGKFADALLQSVPTLLLALFAALTIAGIVSAGISLFRQKTPLYKRLLALLYLILLPLFVTLGAVCPLLLLTPTSFGISAHSLLCLCSVGLWAGVMISALYPKIPRLSVLLFVPCLLFGLTFSYTYGNVMTSQKQYEEYLTFCIAHDIETLNADDTYQAVTISGRAPHSPETKRLCEKYPLLRSLVPTYLTNSSYLGGTQLLHYTQEKFSFDSLSEEDEILIAGTEPVLANSIYACYESGSKIIICFQ